MLKRTAFIIIVFLYNIVTAQNIGINTSGASPNANAILDVDAAGMSPKAGVLVPCMTTVQRNAIPSPANGLLIYNITTNNINFYNGSFWRSFSDTLITTTIAGGSGVSIGVAINSSGNVAASSALLDISSTTKGLLIPRMTTVQRNAIPSPVAGLMIYSTTTNKIEYYNGTSWQSICDIGADLASGGSQTTAGVAINSSGSAGHQSAMLDISATNKGFLLPRLSNAERNLIPAPQIGLIIYNNTVNKIEFYNGTGWRQIDIAVPNPVTAIYGINTPCQGSTGVTYMVQATSGVSYTWSYTGTGLTIASGQGTNSITVNFSAGATAGNLNVVSSNACGSAATFSYPLTPGGAVGFKTEWATTAPGQSITLPLFNSGGLVFNCTVYWGDASSSLITSSTDIDRIHTYAAAGTYTVEIIGQCEGWDFSYDPVSALKIRKVLSWGNSCGFGGFKFLSSGFYGCQNLTSVASGGIPNAGSSGTVFLHLFYNCINLTSVPPDLFRHHPGATTFENVFYNCSSLTNLPSDLFRYNTLPSSRAFYTTFYNCIGLTSLPTGLFKYNTAVSSEGFYSTFANCSGLTSLPSDLFRYNTAVSLYGFSQTFNNCYGLTSLPGDLFRYNVNVTGELYLTFNNCFNLTSLPEDLFKYNTLLNSFRVTFLGCTGLTSLPNDLFRYNTAATDFTSTFNHCSSLLNLPADLFRYNTLANTFNGTFAECYTLISIPADLFRYNTAVSSQGFSFTFNACHALTSIPTDLFRYNTLVSDYGFSGTFYNCYNLSSIPTDLFRYNTAVGFYGFYRTFYNCWGLAGSIPADLFRYNTACTGFISTFDGCNKLVLNRNIFFADGEEGTRFLNQSVDFTSCFFRTSYTGAVGEAPRLWVCNYGTGTPIKTTCFGGAGNSLTSLSNYPDELITLDVAPATEWAIGDIVTGQTSGRTCTVRGKVTATTYVVNTRSGAYTLGEIIGVTGVPAKLADQGVARPTFTTSGWK